MRSFLAFFTLLFVLPAVAVSVVVTYWLADRDTPVDVKYVWVEPRVVKACDNFDLWINRFARKPTGLRIEMFMSDSRQQSHLPLVTETSDLRGGLGDYSYSVALQVPCTFKPGWAYVERRVYYFRNPIQQYVWPIRGETHRVKFCVTSDDVRPEEVCR